MAEGHDPSGVTLGRYRLLERIGEGGMAEVFKAKSLGVEGFEKTLVLKRIVPRLASHPAFVAMFVHEAKLAVRLSHANIVQVFDLGRHEGVDGGAATYFIAMEYVDGVDLATALQRLPGRGVTGGLPIAAAVYIAGEVAKALDHAHRRVDEQGRPLGIVHRDISPHNVLLSWDGDVKVTDFGIARANDAAPLEGEGPDGAAARVSGKFAYMSPEQSRGEATDARSDLFSLGIVLHQLLTGDNPFAAPTRGETLRRIGAGEYPPLGLVRPDAPPALTAILERLLAKGPAERFTSAAELFEELLAFSYTAGERFGAADLAELLAPLRGSEPETDLGPADVLAERTAADEKTPVEVPRRSTASVPKSAPSDPGRGDRREVTVVVLQIGGARRAEGVESVAEAEWNRRLRETLERHGAWIEEHTSERSVALFGLGDTDGRDGEAAVRAALGAGREVRLGEVLGVGVHSGPISVDDGGLPLRDERLATVLETASRLAAVADGRVAVSPVTARLVRRSFVTEALPTDVRARVDGFIVRGPLAFEAARSRFVGRRSELKRLGSLLAAATRGESQLVLLRGKTGIGKSRLLFEASRRLEKGQYNVAFHSAACPLNGSSEPWSALREMLHSLVGTHADDDPARLLEARPRFRSLGLREPEADALLALLGAPIPIEGGELRAGIRVGFERMVASLAKDRLHCFAFDDAQAIDAETQDAILRVLHRQRHLRVVFVLSQRGESELDAPHMAGLRALQSKRKLHVLDLGELSEPETSQLVETQLGVRSLPVELLSHVRNCAGGHPLFVEELVRELCDTGAVQVMNGSAALRSSASPTAPRTLRTLIADRVSRLAQRERRILQGIAILGEPANTALLASTLEQALPLVDRHLGTLEQRGLVARPSATHVRFASPLYQEIVLDAMAPPVRQELHAMAASVFRSAPPAGGDTAERIAVHALGAGEKEQAVDAFWRAGSERRATGQVEMAVRAMLRGAELAQVAERDVEELLGWLREVGAAVSQTRNGPGLREVLAPIVREVKARGDERQRVLGVVEWARALASVNLFEEGFAALEELDARRFQDASLELPVLAAECELAARHGSIERALSVVLRLEAIGTDLEPRTLMAMSVVRASAGDTAAASSLLDRVEHRGGDIEPALAVTLSKHRAIVQFHLGDYAAAARESSKAAKLALAAGLRFEAAIALHNLGDACDRLGDHPRSYAAFVESLELARQLEHDRLSNVNQLHLCMLDGLRNSEGVEEKLKALIRYADARGYLWDVIEGRYLMARLHVAHGSHERARRLLEEVVHAAETHRNGLVASDARALLARLSPTAS